MSSCLYTNIEHAVLLPILFNLLGHLGSERGDVIMIMQDFPDVYIEKAQYYYIIIIYSILAVL